MIREIREEAWEQLDEAATNACLVALHAVEVCEVMVEDPESDRAKQLARARNRVTEALHALRDAVDHKRATEQHTASKVPTAWKHCLTGRGSSRVHKARRRRGDFDV